MSSFRNFSSSKRRVLEFRDTTANSNDKTFTTDYDYCEIAAISVYWQANSTVGTRDLCMYVFPASDEGNAIFYQSFAAPTASQSKTYVLTPNGTDESENALGITQINIPRIIIGNRCSVAIRDDNAVSSTDDFTLLIQYIAE